MQVPHSVSFRRFVAPFVSAFALSLFGALTIAHPAAAQVTLTVNDLNPTFTRPNSGTTTYHLTGSVDLGAFFPGANYSASIENPTYNGVTLNDLFFTGAGVLNTGVDAGFQSFLDAINADTTGTQTRTYTGDLYFVEVADVNNLGLYNLSAGALLDGAARAPELGVDGGLDAGYDFKEYSVNVIADAAAPEPGSFILAALPLAGIVLHRRRRLR